MVHSGMRTIKVRIIKKGFLWYAAQVLLGGVWHLAGFALTKHGARKVVREYLNPKSRIVEEYMVESR